MADKGRKRRTSEQKQKKADERGLKWTMVERLRTDHIP